ncbi:hypothetical protein PGT21_014231 [Puccinia graminis f. sp. tritici]|uniref:Uncharacterized protein n=1 Tax=Puccinia graminis f. sp. tritici TaxID=56615 RepID=A0A5B0QFI4_PUCGR|nr:hypothetical protein PGT21_014231 [Puccinia graminis f. sp. tritici]
MQGIMGNEQTSCWNLRQNLIRKASESQDYDKREFEDQYHELRNLISEIKSQSVSGSLDKIKTHYSRKLMDKISEFKIMTIHSPIRILLQNHSESWTYVKLIASQEFSSISSTNANKLILLLEHGHRLRRNLPILHRIYYCMTKTEDDEKGLIMDLVGRRLKLIENKIKKGELKIMREIYEIIQQNLSQICYKTWTNKLLKPLSILPHYSAKLFDDLLFESSKHTILSKFSSYERLFNASVFNGPITIDLLTPEAHTKLNEFFNDTLLASVEEEIEFMAYMLKKGSIDTHLEKDVGYVFRDAIMPS